MLSKKQFGIAAIQANAATRALNTMTPWPTHFDAWVCPWDATRTEEQLLCGCHIFSKQNAAVVSVLGSSSKDSWIETTFR